MLLQKISMFSSRHTVKTLLENDPEKEIQKLYYLINKLKTDLVNIRR